MPTTYPYAIAGTHLLNGRINVGSDSFKVSLHTNLYIPDPGHDYFNDVTNEVSGPGYTAGGLALTSPAATYDSVAHTTALLFANPSWSTVTTTFRYAVWRKDTGTGSTSPLIAYTDFGSDQTVVAGPIDFTISSALIKIQ